MVRRESGQATSEYAIVIFMIAVVCIAAALFVGFALAGRFESDGDQVGRVPFEPPTPAPAALAWPTTVEECEDGGWRNFAQFASEDECVEYVVGLTP